MCETWETLHGNVVLSANRLIPLAGSTTVAHSTRQTILDLLNRYHGSGDSGAQQRTMIVDISALVWNFDTYAIVGGNPTPVILRAKDMTELIDACNLDLSKSQEGVLVVQTGVLISPTSVPGSVSTWVPKNAVLMEEKRISDTETEFIFRPEVDPNNDRLELWEQHVIGAGQHLETTRATQASGCIRSMMRFFELDRVICWDLSWGAWEAVRVPGATDTTGFPEMTLCGHPYPSLNLSNKDQMPVDPKDFNRLAQPITTEFLKNSLDESQGYYLLGGSTYTMALFHNMWNCQENGGHKDHLRNLVARQRLFYMGHSAGAIFSGPNVLTATWKCIDAFSHSVQPYNFGIRDGSSQLESFVRLPPSESPESFALPYAKKNDLIASRNHMLSKMKKYNGFCGFRVVEQLTFPHYDARPQIESFPQSAETYLRATDEEGKFSQQKPSFLVDADEPADVCNLREATNAQGIPTFPIANGHSIVLSPGKSSAIVRTCSPEEEGQPGVLHWDTYMPAVADPEYTFAEYVDGKTMFSKGFFSGKAVAGDRSMTEPYHGGRLLSRLMALGLPWPEAGDTGLFQTSK